jgi:hypothetical protein
MRRNTAALAGDRRGHKAGDAERAEMEARYEAVLGSAEGESELDSIDKDSIHDHVRGAAGARLALVTPGPLLRRPHPRDEATKRE